jgi:hypothetical protein
MSKTTLVWLAIYWGGAVMSFVNPLYGLLAYVFEYYLRPSLHWWGEPLPNLRWSLLISLVVGASYALRRHSLPELRPLANKALPWLMCLGAIMVLVTLGPAVSYQASLNSTIAFWKLIVLYVLIVAIVRTRWAFDAFIAVHIAGALYWGWEAYTDPDRAQGRLMNVGSSDTLNDNLAAAHLLTVLPFVLVFLLTSKDKRQRVLGLISAPFIINTIILCNSRGATVGMVAALGFAFLIASWRVRVRLMGVAAGVVAGFLWLADPEFIARQQTTIDYEGQATAQNRLESWRGGLELVSDYPLGAGGRGYAILSPVYIPAIVDEHGGQQRAPHNTYVLTASEWGVAGLILLVGFLVHTFVALHRVRKRAAAADWYYYRSLALQLALIATLTAGTFSDRLYGESIYWMCALAIALQRVQHTELAADEPVVTVPVETRRSVWRPAAATALSRGALTQTAPNRLAPGRPSAT